MSTLTAWFCACWPRTRRTRGTWRCRSTSRCCRPSAATTTSTSCASRACIALHSCWATRRRRRSPTKPPPPPPPPSPSPSRVVPRTTTATSHVTCTASWSPTRRARPSPATLCATSAATARRAAGTTSGCPAWPCTSDDPPPSSSDEESEDHGGFLKTTYRNLQTEDRQELLLLLLQAGGDTDGRRCGVTGPTRQSGDPCGPAVSVPVSVSGTAASPVGGYRGYLRDVSELTVCGN